MGVSAHLECVGVIVVLDQLELCEGLLKLAYDLRAVCLDVGPLHELVDVELPGLEQDPV